MRLKWALIILGVSAVSIAGCALPYYMQAIHGQVGLLRQRVPIEEVIASPSYDQETRDRLELVTRLRAFAVSDLGLPDNESYTSYVDLGRDYVVWNVIAAEEFSIEPKTWCFPIAGCVAYRGYFDRDKAEAFAMRLVDQGYETYTGGSAAYSTLGHFADPVLNTMLRSSDTAIAATLFHELAHQQAYVKDDTELSESFATAVEQYGVELWLGARAQTDALSAYRSSLDRQRQFAGLVASQRERLSALYASGVGSDEMRRAKEESFARMRRDYEALKQSWGGSEDYDYWFSAELNNARLVAVTSYQRWVSGLRSRLDVLGPGAFFDEFAALASQDAEARTETLELWNQASAVSAVADQG